MGKETKTSQKKNNTSSAYTTIAIIVLSLGACIGFMALLVSVFYAVIIFVITFVLCFLLHTASVIIQLLEDIKNKIQ